MSFGLGGWICACEWIWLMSYKLAWDLALRETQRVGHMTKMQDTTVYDMSSDWLLLIRWIYYCGHGKHAKVRKQGGAG